MDWDRNLTYEYQPESFTLATLKFTGVSEGLGHFDLSYVDLSDEYGNSLTSDFLENTAVTVVPELATVVLLGLGLIGILGRSIKKSGFF